MSNLVEYDSNRSPSDKAQAEVNALQQPVAVMPSGMVGCMGLGDSMQHCSRHKAAGLHAQTPQECQVWHVRVLGSRKERRQSSEIEAACEPRHRKAKQFGFVSRDDRGRISGRLDAQRHRETQLAGRHYGEGLGLSGRVVSSLVNGNLSLLSPAYICWASLKRSWLLMQQACRAFGVVVLEDRYHQRVEQRVEGREGFSCNKSSLAPVAAPH